MEFGNPGAHHEPQRQAQATLQLFVHQAAKLPGRRQPVNGQLLLKTRNSRIGNPAGNDVPETPEIIPEVERETVGGDPAIAAHSHGGNLSRRRASDPDTCPLLNPDTLQAKPAQHSDNPVFESAQVEMNISTAECVIQVNNGIADQLPRLVAGNIASPWSLDNGHSAGLDVLYPQKQVI